MKTRKSILQANLQMTYFVLSLLEGGNSMFFWLHLFSIKMDLEDTHNRS